MQLRDGEKSSGGWTERWRWKDRGKRGWEVRRVAKGCIWRQRDEESRKAESKMTGHEGEENSEETQRWGEGEREWEGEGTKKRKVEERAREVGWRESREQVDLDQEVDLLCDSQTPIPFSLNPLFCPVFPVVSGPEVQSHNDCSVSSCQVKSNCPVIGQGTQCWWTHCPWWASLWPAITTPARGMAGKIQEEASWAKRCASWPWAIALPPGASIWTQAGGINDI